jgi:hypothetical protein
MPRAGYKFNRNKRLQKLYGVVGSQVWHWNRMLNEIVQYTVQQVGKCNARVSRVIRMNRSLPWNASQRSQSLCGAVVSGSNAGPDRGA